MMLSGVFISQKHTKKDTQKSVQSVTDINKACQGTAMLLRSLRTSGSESIIVVIYTKVDSVSQLD